jgi:site-specific DNA-methyltransferase (adenine-specific)
MITIHQSDAVKWANEYDGPLFHALLCDPPYHLTSIVKRFGKEGSAPAQFGTDGAFSRASKGFMGQTWDGGDVAFQPETWSAFMKVLHPGAFGMAFASSRGWHRLAVAIEDAGFVIHPTIFGWLYGSGFPKATRIDTQIDRDSGMDQKIIGKSNRHVSGKQDQRTEGLCGSKTFSETIGMGQFLKEPATALAKAWIGHRYGLQALKPALEPIIVFQKPYEGKPIDCMAETGAGALNIDGARIPADKPYTINTWDDGAHPFGDGAGNPFTGREETGRWPANFILEDEGAADALDAQSGHLKSGNNCTRRQEGTFLEHGGLGKAGDVQKTIGDEGGASRFFFRVQEQIDESDPVYYCSKASKSERDDGMECHNSHPTVKPIALAKYLATLLLPPAMYAPRRIFVPFAGVASECIGAHQALWEEIVGIEMEEKYCDIARVRAKYWENRGVQLELLK